MTHLCHMASMMLVESSVSKPAFRIVLSKERMREVISPLSSP